MPDCFTNIFCGEPNNRSFYLPVTEWTDVTQESRRLLLEHLELRQLLRDGLEILTKDGGIPMEKAQSLAAAEYRRRATSIYDKDHAHLVSWTRTRPARHELGLRYFPEEKRAWVEIEINRSHTASAFHELARKGFITKITDELMKQIAAPASASEDTISIHHEAETTRFDTVTAWLRRGFPDPFEWDALSVDEADERLLDLYCYQWAQCGKPRPDTRPKTYRHNPTDDRLYLRSLEMSDTESRDRVMKVHRRMTPKWKAILGNELQPAIQSRKLRLPFICEEHVSFSDWDASTKSDLPLTREKFGEAKASAAAEKQAGHFSQAIAIRAIRILSNANHLDDRRGRLAELSRLAKPIIHDGRRRTGMTVVLDDALKRLASRPTSESEDALIINFDAMVTWIAEEMVASRKLGRLAIIVRFLSNSTHLNEIISETGVNLNISKRSAHGLIPKMISEILKQAKEASK